MPLKMPTSSSSTVSMLPLSATTAPASPHLCRQITGVEQPNGGQIFFDGREVHFSTPLEARKAGIETVFQNLALANDLDVPANIFLGREEVYFNLGPFSFLNEKKMLRRCPKKG